MTNDEILAALENARMDLERARRTLSPFASRVSQDAIECILDALEEIDVLKQEVANERG
jgi:hypothetical protein